MPAPGTLLAIKGTDARPSIATSVYHMGLKQVENQVNVLKERKKRKTNQHIKTNQPKHQIKTNMLR